MTTNQYEPMRGFRVSDELWADFKRLVAKREERTPSAQLRIIIEREVRAARLAEQTHEVTK